MAPVSNTASNIPPVERNRYCGFHRLAEKCRRGNGPSISNICSGTERYRQAGIRIRPRRIHRHAIIDFPRLHLFARHIDVPIEMAEPVQADKRTDIGAMAARKSINAGKQGDRLY